MKEPNKHKGDDYILQKIKELADKLVMDGAVWLVVCFLKALFDLLS